MFNQLQTIVDSMQPLGAYTTRIQIAVLIALLLTATVIDIRERRIPNWLVATGMVTGSLIHMTSQGMGIIFSLTGVMTGLALLFPLYLMRVMGAGDVKLMGMIGIFLGMSGVFGAVVATLAAGGILALVAAASKRMLPELFANLYIMLVFRRTRQLDGAVACRTPMPSVGKMPYALAILAGTLTQLFVLRY